MIFWKLVADYGDLASIAGLILSLIGFYDLQCTSSEESRRTSPRGRVANEVSAPRP